MPYEAAVRGDIQTIPFSSCPPWCRGAVVPCPLLALHFYLLPASFGLGGRRPRLKPRVGTLLRVLRSVAQPGDCDVGRLIQKAPDFLLYSSRQFAMMCPLNTSGGARPSNSVHFLQTSLIFQHSQTAFNSSQPASTDPPLPASQTVDPPPAALETPRRFSRNGRHEATAAATLDEEAEG